MKRSLSQPHLMIVIHSLAGGGAERVATDLGGYWVQQGYRVSLVTQADPSTDAYPLHPRIVRHVLGTAGQSTGKIKGMLANLVRVHRLRRLIRRQRPSVVLGMMTTSSVLAILAAKGTPCRVIATEHTHPPSQQLSAVWQRLRRRTYPRAHAVVTLTTGTQQWLATHVPGCRLAVIPNAVRWPLQPVDPEITPADKRGRFRLLAVGRLHYDKGFDVLLAAFAQLAAYYPMWDLVILGEGSERAALEAQVAQSGLESRVCLPGRAGNVGDWYQASDLYVLSSRVEGFSNTLLEAMANGLPVVAFDCETGPREIVRPDIDGALVRPANDVDALAAYLSELMGKPEKRALYGRRALDVRDRFSMARVMRLWQSLFESE